MSKNQKQIYIAIFIAVIFGVSALVTWEKTEDTITTPSPLLNKDGVETTKEIPPILNQGGVRGGNSVSQKTQTENIGSVTVSAGDVKINLEPDRTFYDALVQAKNSGTIDFSGKNYIGLGFFVTDMGTLHAGSGKYLIYYINGKEATVGVSSYTLKNGDVIEWKFE